MSNNTLAVLIVTLFAVLSAVAVYTNTPQETQGQIRYVEQIPVTYTMDATSTEIIWVSDREKVREALDGYFEQTGKLAVGLSMRISEKCVIYAFEPEYVDDRSSDILGHELLHCFRGTVHN